MDVLIRNKQVRLTPSSVIGGGGEAEIYTIGGGEVAKIFKQPNHPDFGGDVQAQELARRRLREHEKKLIAFPRALPSNVITPTSIITSSQTRSVVGYSMKFLQGAEVLLKYGERKYREAHAIDNNSAILILKNLHDLVKGVHRSSVVIGDFNDLNVMVNKRDETFLVDADSMQFGPFTSSMFTVRFVDPLSCKMHDGVDLVRPHSESSDWYAYAIMLMQTLLYVGPYGGVHAPTDPRKKLKDWQRLQKRVTVFDKDVRYPKPAMHFSILPDDVLEYINKVFVRDVRGEFPKQLLDGMRFKKCIQCGVMHAKASCPHCMQASPVAVKEVIAGNVEAKKVLETSGVVVYAKAENGNIKYVYYEGGAYYRENRHTVLEGSLDGSLRFRVSNTKTIVAQDGQVAVIGEQGKNQLLVADMFRDKVAAVDANADAVFIVQGGKLIRQNDGDTEYVDTLGSVLSSQTLVWVGDELGFTYSQVSTLMEANVFRTLGKTIGSPAMLPKIQGHVLDATVVFSKEYVWFLVALDVSGKLYNRAFMFDAYGALVAETQAIAGDGSWLSSIRGKCAHKKQLFCPTDDGIVRVEEVNGKLQEVKVFSNTTRFVDSASKLLFGSDGIYVTQTSRVWRLRIA